MVASMNIFLDMGFNFEILVLWQTLAVITTAELCLLLMQMLVFGFVP